MLNLFSGFKDLEEFEKATSARLAVIEKKAIEKELPPSYLKFYPIWQYDRLKFRKLLNVWLDSPEGKSRTQGSLEKKQAEILEKCYKKDKLGRLRDSDEKHIFRYRTLHKIYKEIYKWSGVNPFLKGKSEFEGLIVWRDEYTKEKYLYKGQEFNGQNFIDYGACVNGCENLTVYKRVKIHIALLRLLRAKMPINEAIKKVLTQFNICGTI